MLTIKDLKLSLGMQSIGTRGLSHAELIELATVHNIIERGQSIAGVEQTTPKSFLTIEQIEQMKFAGEQNTPKPEFKPEPTPTPTTPTTPTQDETPMNTPTPTNAQQDALNALLATLTPTSAGLTEQQVIALISEHAPVKSYSFTNTTTNTVKTIKDTVLHSAFKKSFNHLSIGNDVYFYGASGAGKSTTAEHIATALDTPFFIQGAILAKFEALGSLTATAYNKSVIRRWLESEKGGLLCIDEIDSSCPRALVSIMAIFDKSGSLTFPDGATFRRTPNHKLIVTANTKGAGASAQYNGRVRLDSATLNRFIRIEHGYCEQVENSLAPKNIVKYAREFRKAIDAKGLDGALITPRTIVQLGNIYASELSADDKKDMYTDTLKQGLTDSEYKTITSKLGTI